MSFQIKSLKDRKNKKGVSIMVGYVLLVSFAVIIGVITYGWIKTYAPTESIECSDGTSLFLRGSYFDDVSDPHVLTVTLKNNGRFNIDGYFIRISNDSSQEIPNIGIAEYISSGGGREGNRILAEILPDNEITSTFEIPDSIGEPLEISIIPIRTQVFGNRERSVTCGDSRIVQAVGAGSVGEIVGGGCTPTTCSELGYTCGTWSDGCGGEVTCDTCNNEGEVCSGGQCIAEEECTDTCSSLGYECGLQTICGEQVDCSSEVGGCSGAEVCNVEGICELICGNGEIDSGEECDGGANCQIDCSCPSGYVSDGELGCTTIGNGVCDSGETCSQEPACEGEQASCVEGQICESSVCVWQGGAYGEDEYCADLGYLNGDCLSNSGQCTSESGTDESQSPGAGEYCGPDKVLCCFS